MAASPAVVFLTVCILFVFPVNCVKVRGPIDVNDPSPPPSFLEEHKQVRWAKLIKGDTVKLKEFGVFRKKFVDATIAKAVKSKCPSCTAISVGSTNPTSDYDITVTGPQANVVVKTFNGDFEKLAGVTSGEVFDTNVYAAQWVHPSSAMKNKCFRPANELGEGLVLFRNFPKGQELEHRYAYAKTLNYMSKLCDSDEGLCMKNVIQNQITHLLLVLKLRVGQLELLLLEKPYGTYKKITNNCWI